MRKIALFLAFVATISVTSCKKLSLQDTVVTPPAPTAPEVIVPVGFTWENSRSINFTVNVTDTRFQNMLHVISIYDAAPSAGGVLIAKGSASTISGFKNKLYLSKQISEVYIVKTSPDNSTSIQKVQVGNADIFLSVAE
jgi:hypothetical protein